MRQTPEPGAVGEEATGLRTSAVTKLSIEKLNVSFGSVTALSDVSLDIADGEFVCILGASGCGKSTLFNVVSGLLQASSGKIVLDGQDVSSRPGQVGYMLQKLSLIHI